MYNTPDKHNRSSTGRSQFDFSDIDHLDRATEAFMKEQRKALGHRTVNLDAIAEQGKRALVFVVLGAVFVTALVAGIRFGISDDALRDPNSSVSDSMVESGTNQTTDGSSNDKPKDDANGAATTPEPEAPVTTEPTTYQDEPALSTTLPQFTDSDVVMLTTATTTTTPDVNLTTLAGTTTKKTTTQKTTTSRTTTPKSTIRTTPTMTSTTTRKTTTTTTTSTTRKTTTTTPKTTTSTTTTTTTTTAAKKANLTVKSSRVVSCEQNDTYSFIVKVRVYLKNTGDAAASNVSTTILANNCTYVTTDSDDWSTVLSGGRPVAEYYGTVAPGEEVCATIYFITDSYLSSCSASCSYS